MRDDKRRYDGSDENNHYDKPKRSLRKEVGRQASFYHEKEQDIPLPDWRENEALVRNMLS